MRRVSGQVARREGKQPTDSEQRRGPALSIKPRHGCSLGASVCQAQRGILERQKMWPYSRLLARDRNNGSH